MNQRLGAFGREVFPYTRYIAQMEERRFTNSSNLSFIIEMFIKHHTNAESEGFIE